MVSANKEMNDLTKELLVDTEINSAAYHNGLISELGRSKRSGFKYVGATIGVLTLGYIASKIPKVLAADAYVVGYQSKAPTIDGVWGDGEWDDANELTIANVSNKVNDKIGNAYFRAKHDDKLLNWIAAAPFDDGTVIAPYPKDQTTINFNIDGNDDGLDVKDPNDTTFWARVENGQASLGYLTTNSYLLADPSQIKIVENIGTSPHSDKPHRIWEGSLPLEPMIRNSPKTQDDSSPLINVQIGVGDTYGNYITLTPLGPNGFMEI